MEFYEICTLRDGERYLHYLGFVDIEEYERISGCYVQLDTFLESEERGELLSDEATACKQFGKSVYSDSDAFSVSNLADFIKTLIGDSSNTYLPFHKVGKHTADGVYYCESFVGDYVFTRFTIGDSLHLLCLC